jgi:hypothetical protein
MQLRMLIAAARAAGKPDRRCIGQARRAVIAN